MNFSTTTNSSLSLYQTFTPNISILFIFRNKHNLIPRMELEIQSFGYGSDQTHVPKKESPKCKTENHSNIDYAAAPLWNISKVTLCLIKHCAMKACIIRALRNSALDVDKRPDFTNRMPCPRAKQHLRSVNRKLGWPNSLTGRFEDEENLLPLPGIDLPIPQSFIS
jgi:hypothetical protein